MITDLNRLDEVLNGNENGFFNCDCMDLMRLLPDKSIPVLHADPPYGINATSFGGGAGLKDRSKKGMSIRQREKERKGRLNQGAGVLKDRALNTLNCAWDSETPKPEYFSEAFRVSVNQILWGGNYFTFKLVDGKPCGLPPTRGIVIWDKMQPWENFSQFELAWTSFDCPAWMIRERSTREKGKIHATQKNLKVIKAVIERFAKPGDLILDTHAGSGTTCVAASQTGHRYIGCEIDEFYYEKALERIQNVEAQANIFTTFGEEIYAST